MKNLKLAVIGKDVSKSSSPEMHTFIASKMGNSITYDKISISEENFENQVESMFKRYDGFNVTIPYKLSIIKHLAKVSGDAQVFGAVNTVKCDVRSGHNTDGMGFMLMLKNGGVEVSGKDILLLGAGGAGRSVAKKLSDAGAKVSVYDRRFENSRAVAEEFANVTALEKLEALPYFAIINASGVGMHKTEGISPVGDDLISGCSVAVDLIYVPAKSRFLQIAENLNKKIINGEAMLFYQAYFAQCIYFNLTPDDSQAKKLFGEYKEKI